MAKVLLEKAIQLLSIRDYSEHELRCRLLRTARENELKDKCIHAIAVNKNESLYNEDDDEQKEIQVAQLQSDIDQVIHYCHVHHWLDDEKYAQLFINKRHRQGYGPQRIKVELLQKGINQEIVHRSITESEIDWCQLALLIVEKKFGTNLSNKQQDKARVFRYLKYRGFSQDDILFVLSKVFTLNYIS